MEITLSENLKELRYKKGDTQEDLAAYLGISFQAISKWERNEAYPDITLLPKIAAYYNVSIDDLLGVGKIREQEKVAELFAKDDAYQQKGDFKSADAIWIEAIKEFPNNPTVLGKYIGTLPDERSDEKIQLYEKLLKELDDSSHKWLIIRTVCHLYAHRLENEEKAVEWANKAPWLDITQTHLLTEIYKGAKLVETVQVNLLREYVYTIDDEIHDMTWKGDLNNSEQRKARQRCLKLWEWLFEDGDYGVYNMRIARVYADLAVFDAVDKNTDGVIENLSLMADYSIKFVTDKSDAKRTSFLLNRTQLEAGFQGYPNGPDNECMVYLKFMKKDCFDYCREDERFKEIEKRLAEYADEIK